MYLYAPSRGPQYDGLQLGDSELGDVPCRRGKCPADLAELRCALLKRITKTDLMWLDVPLRDGFSIKVCSPVCIHVSQQELRRYAAYLDGQIPANGLWAYLPVTAEETKDLAHRWSVFPLTRAVSDQAHNAAVYVPWPPGDWASAAKICNFLLYSRKLRYFSYQGWALVSGAHKVWVLSAKETAAKAVNHGFQWPISLCQKSGIKVCIPGPRLKKGFAAVQNLGARHDHAHWDYSQLLQLMTDLKDPQGQVVDLRAALLSGHPAVWDEPAMLPEAHLPSAAKGARAAARVHGLGWFGEPPALVDLIRFSQAQTQATVANALSIVRLISRFHGIPWRVPFVILEHEGGIRAFDHPDGVMQVTDAAKPRAIHAMPRELKLVLAGRALTDQIATAPLDAAVRTEFPRRLAVQIAGGIQLLKNALDRFAGYVALAYVAYNAGDGSAARVVTGGRATNRPAGTTDELWESMCRFAASLYHQLPRDVRIATGQWQCDANIPAWFRRFAVFDRNSGQNLIAYPYLRSIQSCIRPVRPAIPCTRASHGQRHDGAGNVACSTTRAGAFDKLYAPAQLGQLYRDAIAGFLAPIPQDNLPIKVLDGRLVKMPLASGPAAPQGNPFEGIDGYP
jgi:hypothetical protein